MKAVLVLVLATVPLEVGAQQHFRQIAPGIRDHVEQAFLDRMTMAIGGRVAEEIVFERVSTGAQNDLERITKMAYAMVVDYGMSEEIGYVSFNLSNRGNDSPMFDKPYSDETARMIDEEVKAEVMESVEFAENSPFPELEAIYEDVYDPETEHPNLFLA